MAHQLMVRRVNEAGGLRVVDRIEESVMEEGILDVELVHGPTLEINKVSTDRTVVGLTTGQEVSS
jgi:hypothetical protein